MLVWKKIEASTIKLGIILNNVEHENNDVDKLLQELKEVEGVCKNIFVLSVQYNKFVTSWTSMFN